MARHVPDGHRQFGRKLLADHGVPELPDEERHHELLGWTSVTAGPQVDVILRHEPPGWWPTHWARRRPTWSPASRRAGGWSAPCAARCATPCGTRRPGSTSWSARAPRVAGTAARSPRWCCGPRSSTRSPRCPCSLRAASGRPPGGRRPGHGRPGGVDRLAVAHGGRGRRAPAQMQTYLDATSHDTVRSRSFTGKPCRMLRNDWTEAWEAARTRPARCPCRCR